MERWWIGRHRVPENQRFWGSHLKVFVAVAQKGRLVLTSKAFCGTRVPVFLQSKPPLWLRLTDGGPDSEAPFSFCFFGWDSVGWRHDRTPVQLAREYHPVRVGTGTVKSASSTVISRLSETNCNVSMAGNLRQRRLLRSASTLEYSRSGRGSSP